MSKKFSDIHEQMKELVLKMRIHKYGPAADQPLEPAFSAEIDQLPRPAFIAGVFIVNKSSVAQDLLGSLPQLMGRINYADLTEAFEQMEDDELAIYYYTPFLSSIFGVDPYGMAEENPAIRKELGLIMRAGQRGTHAPNDWSDEYLSDRNISQRDLLDRMKNQGAPLLRAPNKSKV